MNGRTLGDAARAALSAVAWSVLVVGCGAGEPTPVAAPVIEVEGDPGGQTLAPSEVTESAPKPDHATCIANLVAATSLSSQGADAELFDAALKARTAGDKMTSRRRLLELTENHKRSPLVPRAYLLFGEMFAEEAAEDPSRWPVAAKFYGEVMKYPYPENDVFFYAALSHGETQSRQGNHPEALIAYKRVLEGQAKYPDAPCRETIGDAARTAVVASYAEVGDPRKAVMFFRTLGADPHRLVLDLAVVYAQAGKTREARVVVEQVLARRPAKATCVALARVVAEHGLGVSVAPACP